MDKYQSAQKKYEQALEAAWQQRQMAIKLGASYSDYSATYYTALDVAEQEYRSIVPDIVQPTGVD